ncbi:class I SAM-dependent methyltransferase [Dokdonia sinensis]|uniref:Class I SAM-dependent methyltransferase n=1 Tax=Dokdonia sinensis TaxID=2479847 RepID=A0A3M0G6L8_9FLAO|nr:class I SAM-dependent methyltransferase [Dokdonia sinensis]RMB57413.1 class I SAM-dependent methyltransferase [Dokdonia sinensis]
MPSIDHAKLKANPQDENFSGKYNNQGRIAKYLVNNYFVSVSKLLDRLEDVHAAHEIGAGVGESTARLRAFLPFLTASEFVPDNVQKASILNPRTKIFQESVYDLTYEDNSTDLVFLLEVLEHLDHPEVALKELKRISKRYLILGVPREPIWRILNMCRFKYWGDLGNTPGHLNHWSKSSIIKLIERNFGKVIAVETPLPWTILLAEKEIY